MKKIKMFERFDYPAFVKGKKLAVVEISDYVDYDSKEHIGSKVKVAIVEDHTDYGIVDGKPVTNKYEFMTFKVKKDIDLPVDTIVVAKNVTATVYGEYHNQLSLYCDDIIAVESGKDDSRA